MNALLHFVVHNKLVVLVLLAALTLAGALVAPFDAFDAIDLPRAPLAVDAIPDIGENQQIVFTEWDGRSPRDIEDQVTYPLTATLLGMPGVRTVRSMSMFGFSSIYVIFDDATEFYWSRARILEKLSSLPPGTLPDGVRPTLGPDATGLGQVYWYTLEGRTPSGEPAGGWDLHELRTLQDWTIRYALQAVPGVSEVASIGGHVQELQIELDPDAMRAHDVTLADVVDAVRATNLDVGARTLEVNAVEYIVRGIGLLESQDDLEKTVIAVRDNTPLLVRDVGRVTLGPAERRGALDVGGAEAVGGVVVARYGDNPQRVLQHVHQKIADIQATLPQRTLEDGTVSKVTIVPFYDRSQLIGETIGTLSTALWQQLLVTLIVVLVMLGSLRTSLLVGLVLPLGVLATFVAMHLFGVSANIMSLAGIAIAIGTMVDMGIVIVENIIEHLEAADPDEPRAAVVIRASAEVAPAVFTSAATTVVSFLPVFALTAAEGKMFTPLAYTKTFVVMASLAIAVITVPVFAALLLRRHSAPTRTSRIACLVVAAGLTVLLALDWRPLGFDRSTGLNVLAAMAILGTLLGAFALFLRFYERLLRAFLANAIAFLAVPCVLVAVALTAWLGFDRTLGWLPDSIRLQPGVVQLAHAFPGFGREFMPAFDEGQFLFMPTTMPHASFGEALSILKETDAAIAAIPEVKDVVGKLGRVDSALDPAPVSMFEIVITYEPEYVVRDGKRVRQWRDHIRRPDDIWEEITRVAARPGLTSAPKLMPIETRLVMLQTGMRAAMGVKVQAPDLRSLEIASLRLERALTHVPAIRPQTVFAERVTGKPYVEIEIDRDAITRYGLTVGAVQETIQHAIGGVQLTRMIKGRERIAVTARLMREERGSLEAVRRLMIATPTGVQVPLEQLATIDTVRGPQTIQSEDTFLTSYITFDGDPSVSEAQVVEFAAARLSALIASGQLTLPDNVTYSFTGEYENQVRSEQRLTLLVPLALAVVLLLIYLQFRSISTTLIIYSAVLVAASGGFLMLWGMNQPWFLAVGDLREIFNIAPTNLSIGVWVGLIALIGLATDDGVVMATYLHQRFDAEPPTTLEELRELVVQAGLRRVRPCLMTTGTTLLALLPVLTATGRGADIMRPMAVPLVGGMSIALMTLFVVPVAFALWQGILLWARQRTRTM